MPGESLSSTITVSSKSFPAVRTAVVLLAATAGLAVAGRVPFPPPFHTLGGFAVSFGFPAPLAHAICTGDFL